MVKFSEESCDECTLKKFELEVLNVRMFIQICRVIETQVHIPCIGWKKWRNKLKKWNWKQTRWIREK
jgi:hypothetical protein